MINIQPASEPRKGVGKPTVGLALAGGGPLGGTYEVGALMALDEALQGANLTRMDVYVGVSSGALVAAALANNVSAAQLCRIFVKSDSLENVFNPDFFFKPAFSEYLKRAFTVPELWTSTVFRFITHPFGFGIMESISGFNPAMPTGVFDNTAIHQFLKDLFEAEGRTNDFRLLDRKLYLMAVDLNTSEAVTFGAKGFDHIPISRAVQASSALPGLFPPVEIEGRHYVDGVLRKTLHASAALEEGAELVICVNPIVPFDDSLPSPNGKAKGSSNLMEGGLPAVLSQTFRTLIYSRMKTGMVKYSSEFPSADVVLLEPDRNDSEMFFTNVFSFANRRRVTEHAYQATRRDLLAKSDELEPVLNRHGLSLNIDLLRESRRDYIAAIFDAEAVESH